MKLLEWSVETQLSTQVNWIWIIYVINAGKIEDLPMRLTKNTLLCIKHLRGDEFRPDVTWEELPRFVQNFNTFYFMADGVARYQNRQKLSKVCVFDALTSICSNVKQL